MKQTTAVLAPHALDTEALYDYVTIGGTQFSGTSGPVSVAISAGETLHWQSDSSVVGSGFTICAASPPLPLTRHLPPHRRSHYRHHHPHRQHHHRPPHRRNSVFVGGRGSAFWGAKQTLQSCM